MRTIELNPLSFIASPDEKKFILLRSEQADKDESFLTEFARPKILSRKDANKISGVWGTLGYKNDDPIDWYGTVISSNEGNTDFIDKSTVKDEVEIIKSMYPELEIKGKIKEKFINLNQLEIPMPEVFSLDEIPKLRLDIFLDPDEGALTFYQLKKENDENAELEFIQPQATDSNNSTDKRDRLTYFFNVIPNKSIEEIENVENRFMLSSKPNENDFIIKVLIFRRVIKTINQPTSSTELVKLIEEKLAKYSDGLLVKNHILKIFNPSNNSFSNVQSNSIDTSKKTLLLLHGTFASTKGSFKDVYNWIGTLYGKNKYEQILAFDHPTLFYDAEMNINKLFEKLKSANAEKFEKPVDLIGTSQGGLLAQYLANINQTAMPIGKIALVASANGVDYLSFADGLTTGLKLLRKVLFKLGFAPAALVSALFQHSFEWVLKQPGMAVMQPGNPKLNSIIFQIPNLNSTKYLPIAGNYESTGYFKRKLEFGIDAILDEENDWVVGSKNQFKAPSNFVAIDNYNPGKYREFMIENAKHGSLIEKDEAQNRMEQFFFGDNINSIDFKHLNSDDYFDAHCHLFGRNVITGRLILMILGDLIDYFQKDDEEILLPAVSIREKDKSKSKLNTIIRIVLKYIIFNKNGHQMMHDLEEDYYALKSKTFRYIPLMFDVEMTFRNHYDDNNAIEVISDKMMEFKEEHDKFLNRISDYIDKIDKREKKIFKGKWVHNDESAKILKHTKQILKALKLVDENVFSNAKNSYSIQLEELKQLKTLYGSDIFPFLATDPRRDGMAEDILKYVGNNKTFTGIKIYSPNGYSPTDPHLFDPKVPFVGQKPLYQWCVDNEIAIMAHNSDSGFATFTDKLQVYGDICTEEKAEDCTYKLEFKDKEYIEFKYNLRNGGFAKSVMERAHRLNHPCLWRKVLNRYPTLKICFAHFGGGSDDWQKEITKLILDFENVYTDLSCQTNPKMLEKIKARYFKEDTAENLKIRSRIMYGSDYFLNLIQGIEFANYYKNFDKTFTKKQLRNMKLNVPKAFLGL